MFFYAALTAILIAAAFVAARGRGRKAPLNHIYHCSLGVAQYHGDLRWCYRCLDWVGDPTTACPGSRVACCGSGRS